MLLILAPLFSHFETEECAERIKKVRTLRIFFVQQSIFSPFLLCFLSQSDFLKSMRFMYRQSDGGVIMKQNLCN